MDNKIDSLSAGNSKDEFWQMIRGICIISVILIHCTNGIGFRETSTASWNFDYWLIMRQFIDFPVAIFIFLAGYFTNIERVEKFKLVYVRNRVKRLLLPFLVWSTFYTLLNIVTSGGNINILNSIIKLLFGLSSGQLYFILVLLQLTLITPLLIKTIKNNQGTKILFLLTPLYLLCLYFYGAFFENQLLFYQTYFPAWFIFYYAGLFIRIKGFKPFFKKIQLFNSILFCFIGFILSIIEGYSLLALGYSEGFASSQIKFSSFLYVFAIINLLFVIKPYFEKIEIKWLKYLGENSYGLFYVHMFWITISSAILMFNPLIKDILPIYQLVQLIFVIIFSCGSIFIVKKIIGDSLAGKLLGF